MSRINFGLGRNVYRNIARPSASQFLINANRPQPAAAPNISPNAFPFRRAVVENQMRLPMSSVPSAMTPLQQDIMTKMGYSAPKTPKSNQGLLSGFMPAADTPEAAGLGAAGQRMLELSGYRQIPLTMGEILGAAAKSYTTARGAALQQQRDDAASAAAAERQARIDALERDYKMAQIRKLGAEAGEIEAGPAAPKPEIITMYGPDGREVKALYDFETRKATQIGQPKAEAPKDVQVITIFDKATGREISGYMEGNTFIPLGGPKAEAKQAPQIIEYTDDDGKTRKGVYDFSTGKVANIGGPKKEAPKDRTIVEVFGPGGRVQKGYMDGNTFVPVGELGAAPVDKPSEQFRTVVTPDGKSRSFRADDPALDQFTGQEGVNIISGQVVGTPDQYSMSSVMTRKIEDDLVRADKGLARIENIISGFDPKYFKVDTRAADLVFRTKEKFTDLSPGESKLVSDFADYRSEVNENLNLYIKDITGAQMSVQEAVRLTSALPKIGTGFFDGDSPSEFMGKARRSYRTLLLAKARAKYALENGLIVEEETAGVTDDLAEATGSRTFTAFYNKEGKKFSLQDMENVMENRAKELISVYGDQFQGAELQEAVKRQMKQEFGV